MEIKVEKFYDLAKSRHARAFGPLVINAILRYLDKTGQLPGHYLIKPGFALCDKGDAVICCCGRDQLTVGIWLPEPTHG